MTRPAADRRRFPRALRRGLMVASVVAPLASIGGPSPALGQAPAPAPGGQAPVMVPGFSKAPTTPAELWEAADYLIRTGNPAAAGPLVARFVAANPDDATLAGLRDEYGINSFLHLGDDPSTQPFAAPLLRKVAEAQRRRATEPGRLDEAIAALGKTPGERRYGVDRLREAGAYAVPAVVKVLGRPGLDAADRRAIIGGLGELDTSALAPLVASLGVAEPTVVEAVAIALGRIGDPRATPFLTIPAAGPASPARDAARAAIARISGVPFANQPRPPAQALAAAARSAFLAIPRDRDEPAVAWELDPAKEAPAPRASTRGEVTSDAGLLFARAAVALAPTDLEARATLFGLVADRDPASAPSKEASPVVLAEAARRGVADGRPGVAVAAVEALGPATRRDPKGPGLATLATLVTAADRRVQFAAAKALIELEPKTAFAGSSRVVPALARFVATGAMPRALVIDGNPARGSQTAGFLRSIGYDPQLAVTGDEGFRVAAGTADIELIALDPDLVQGPWGLRDTLANLRSDGRTAGIPAFLVGPLSLRDQYATKMEGFPEIGFLVTPTETAGFKAQIDRALARKAARPLSAEERADLAAKATALLARVANRPASPFAADLHRAAPSLTFALQEPALGVDSATALADIPRIDAQRDLATMVLAPTSPGPTRIAAAEGLARSLRRFGLLLAPDQAGALVATARTAGDDDPAFRSALARAVEAMRPRPMSPAPAPGTIPADRSPRPSAPGI